MKVSGAVFTARSIGMLTLSGASIREACVKLVDAIQIDDELPRTESLCDDAAISN